MTIKLYELTGTDTTRPFSPHCWKTRMCLAHKGLEYESVPVGFTQISGLEDGDGRRVPVMRHGEKIIEDSFQIALYLRDAYPDKGGHLFRGEGAVGLSRVVESWSQSQIHPWIAKWALMDIHDMLNPEDQAFFRKSRETTFKKPLEEVVADRESRRDDLKQILTPIRVMLSKQPYLGGESPLFADYIVFGALQWLRIVSGLQMMDRDDKVMEWFERMLDLHDRLGRSVSEASA